MKIRKKGCEKKMSRQAVPMNLQMLKNNSSRYTKKEINKRKNAENLLKAAKDKIIPPKWLGKIAKDEFNYIVSETQDIELITNLDVHNLALYCNVYEQYIKMTRRINKDGIMVEANKSSEAVVTSHPLFIRQHQLMDQLRKLQTDLGLNPSARAKMAITKAEIDKPKSFIDERFSI